MPRLSEAAREERTGERRGQILHAALQVFSRKGFHGATIREIASVAGLAEGTIYLYFKSKQEVLKGVFALIAEEVASSAPALEEAKDGNDAAFLSALVRNRIQSLAHHASIIRLLVHEADLHEDLQREFFARLHEPFVKRFEGYLQRRIAQGAFRPMNTALASSICFRLIMSYVMTQHVLTLDTGVVRFKEDEYVDTMVGLILDGLVSRPT